MKYLFFVVGILGMLVGGGGVHYFAFTARPDEALACCILAIVGTLFVCGSHGD